MQLPSRKIDAKFYEGVYWMYRVMVFIVKSFDRKIQLGDQYYYTTLEAYLETGYRGWTSCMLSILLQTL